MKRKAIAILPAIILILLFVVRLNAQTSHQIDSMINVLKKETLSGEEKLKLYYNISSGLMYQDTDRGINYAQEGIKLAKKEKNKKMEAALTFRLGSNYTGKGENEKARGIFEKAYKLAVDASDKERQAAILGEIGTSYQDENNFEKAIEYITQSIAIAEEAGIKRAVATSAGNLGIIYRILQNNERSIYYLKLSRKIADEENFPFIKMAMSQAMGNYYHDQDDYDQAIACALEAYELSVEQDNKEYQTLTLSNLASFYSRGKQDYEKALEYILKSEKLAREYGKTDKIVGSLTTKAYIYLEMENYAEAEKAALQGWELDSVSFYNASHLAMALTVSSIQLGKKDKATDYMQKYDLLKDQYMSNSSHEAISALEIKYETEKKEARIAALEKEKKLYLWLSLLTVIIFLLLFGMLFFRHRLNRQKRMMAEQQIKQLEQEKQLIATLSVLEGETAERSRLARDLHDGLGGMLSVVRLNLKDMKSSSHMDEPDIVRLHKASEMLDQSIGELRQVAHHIMPESLIHRGLNVSLEDFCKAIPGANFHYYGNENRLDEQLEVMIYRCAHELVNNAVKHANATRIDVQLIVDTALISLTVHDNGQGFDPETIHSGSGLENIRTRVSAFNGKMNIYSTLDEGSEATIEIERVI